MTPFTMATFNLAYILRQEGEDYTRVQQILIDDIAEAKGKLAEIPEQPRLTLF